AKARHFVNLRISSHARIDRLLHVALDPGRLQLALRSGHDLLRRRSGWGAAAVARGAARADAARSQLLIAQAFGRPSGGRRVLLSLGLGSRGLYEGKRQRAGAADEMQQLL